MAFAQCGYREVLARTTLVRRAGTRTEGYLRVLGIRGFLVGAGLPRRAVASTIGATQRKTQSTPSHCRPKPPSILGGSPARPIHGLTGG